MRLGEALAINARAAGQSPRQVHLLCGFESLHFATLLKAYLNLRFPANSVSLRLGLYGDLEGNIARASETEAQDGAIVMVEWSDLDQRLGFRSSGGWGSSMLSDVAEQVRERCNRLLTHLASLAAKAPVTIVAPTLALPPLSYQPPTRTSAFELQLNAVLLDFLNRACQVHGVNVLNASALAITSPPAARHDVKMDLQAGFPYTLTHADALASMAVNCLFPAAPRKGLITDLDQTLWKGILGDAGVDGISWSLEDKSQAHALYQQLLASLAESGVLVAIASKNDPDVVAAALQRSDLLVSTDMIFPIEASWGPKSDAISRILKHWNVGPESVVFVDDSPMEIAEVAEKHPEIECLLFPSSDAGGILAQLHQLRLLFGKASVGAEDSLRLSSLRAAAHAAEQTATESPDDFMSRLNATVSMEAADWTNTRALELVNKTNQFNLNGKRYIEAEWKAMLQQPGQFLIVVSYQDRFGPLGRIGVVSGTATGDRCTIENWVMSCRAFSRQIEFETLQFLYSKLKVAELQFSFVPTDRNGPLQTFLKRFFSAEQMAAGELNLGVDAFHSHCPKLFHEVIDSWTKSEPSSHTVSL